jgi:hypothetical protein
VDGRGVEQLHGKKEGKTKPSPSCIMQPRLDLLDDVMERLGVNYVYFR